MLSVTSCSDISGAVVVTVVVSVVVSGGAVTAAVVVVFFEVVVTFAAVFAVVSAFELSFVLGISITPEYSVLPRTLSLTCRLL